MDTLIEHALKNAPALAVAVGGVIWVVRIFVRFLKEERIMHAAERKEYRAWMESAHKRFSADLRFALSHPRNGGEAA